MKEKNAKKTFSTKLRVRYSETDKMAFVIMEITHNILRLPE